MPGDTTMQSRKRGPAAKPPPAPPVAPVAPVSHQHKDSCVSLTVEAYRHADAALDYHRDSEHARKIGDKKGEVENREQAYYHLRRMKMARSRQEQMGCDLESEFEMMVAEGPDVGYRPVQTKGGTLYEPPPELKRLEKETRLFRSPGDDKNSLKERGLYLEP